MAGGADTIPLDLAERIAGARTRNAGRARAGEPVPRTDGDWTDQLLLNDKGLPKPRIANALLMIEHRPELSGTLAMSLLGHQMMAMRALPWDVVGPFPRRIRDGDITRCTAHLERLHLELSREAVGAAVAEVACAHAFDPIADYLTGLQWDRTKRIDKLLPMYFGVAENGGVATIGRRFMVSAVARAIHPGTKVDNVLVLEGPQGIRKSTAIKSLFGDDWTLETMEAIGSKDARQQIGGYWAIELPELDHLSKAENSTVKSWITIQRDDFRPPYAKFNIVAPRRCIFVATHNPGNAWLSDPTGARRFWPVTCSAIDCAAIARDRDQLWAEATVAYRAGEKWWTDPDEIAEMKQAQDDRYANDPWHNVIAGWLANTMLGTITMDDIWRDALSVPKDRWDRSAQTRIGTIITRIGGWRKKDRGSDASPRFCYQRAEESEPQHPVGSLE